MRAKRNLAGWLGLAAGAGAIAVLAARQARRIELQGKVVVITGGGRGLGLAIARAFHARGCKLAICGRDGAVITEAEAELRRQGADVLGMPCDASDPAQVANFIDVVLERFGTIDILVNNAGQCFVGPAVELETRHVEAALRNIFWVVYHPTMAVLPHMRSRGFGRVVNVTSFGGKVPFPHQAAYAAGKFAATGWSEVLGVELAKEGVRISTVTPPPLRNGAPLHVHFGGRGEEEFLWFTRSLTSPLTAIDTERTARKVVEAAEHGDLETAVSPTSWLAARAFGLSPNLTARALMLFDRRLPPPAPPGQTSRLLLGSEVLARSHDARVWEVGAAARSDAARYHSDHLQR